MIYFAFIAGKPDRVAESFGKICLSVEAESTFGGGQLKTHLASTKEWAVAAYSVPDPLAKSRLVFSGHGAIAINGPVLGFAGDASGLLIDAALQHLKTGSVEDVYDRMSGAYSCGGFTAKHGLFGFSDFSGVYPTYCYESDGLVAVSNRASVLAALRQHGGYDLNALSWLVGHANIFGPATPFLGVDLVEAGTRVSALNGGRMERREFSSAFPHASEQGLDALGPSEWDEITSDLIDNMRASTAHAERVRIGLTGGKDSRLCLGLALSAGVADRLEIFTTGPDNSPETECAREVAGIVGLQHAAAKQSHIGTHVLPMETMWRRLRSHPRRYEHLVCPWDGQAQGMRGTQVDISGFGGELYRGPGGHAKQFKRAALADPKAAADLWVNYHQQMDPLSVLHPRQARYQTDWLRSWVDENSKRFRLDSLPERFFVTYRMGHWNGPMAQGVAGRIKFMPLLSRKAATAYLRLKPEARSMELLHYEVMKRVAPALASFPFLKQTWAPAILDQDASLPREAYRSTTVATAENISPWQFNFVRQERDGIVSLLRRAEAETEIDKIFNVANLCAHVASDLSRTADVKAVLSAVGIAHSLLGETENLLDSPDA